MATVAVNGAGLVGSLAAAMLCARKDVKEVHMFEKRGNIREEKATAGRSINLILTSRGLFALREAGLEKEAMELCVPVEGRMMHDLEGKTVFTPYGIQPNEVNYSVSRAGLNALLQQKAEERGCKIHYHHDLVNLNFETKEAVFEATDDEKGTNKRQVTKRFDVYFGTDGVLSPLRKLISTQLNKDGVPNVVDTFIPLGVAYKEVSFPCDPKTQEYSMDRRALHIWPRGPHFLMGLADLKNTFTGTLYLPDGTAKLPIPESSKKVPFFSDIEGPSKKAALHQYVEDAYPDVPNLVPDIEQQLNSRRAGQLATTVCNKWNYKGVAVIFGDASHGITPFFGQGMNSGFESWIILTRLMDQYGDLGCGGGAGLQRAFDEFTRIRPIDTTAIGQMAAENFVEMSFKVGEPDFLRRKGIENTIEKEFPKQLRSRYYMVVATLIPYDVVKQAGVYIERCIDEIIAAKDDKSSAKYNAFLQKNNGSTGEVFGAGPIEGISKEFVLECIKLHVSPFLMSNGIDLNQPLKPFYPGFSSEGRLAKTGGSKL